MAVLRESSMLRPVILALVFVSAASVASAAPDNVSITFSHSMGGETYIDDRQLPEGTYTDSGIDFPYVVTQLTAPELLVGLVSTGDFLQLSYSQQNGYTRMRVTQAYSNVSGTSRVFVPFTAAGHAAVENRQEAILGGLFGSGGLLSYANPSFAFELRTVKLIRVTLDYTDERIDLIGLNESISSGVHRIGLQNRGVNAQGEVVIEVSGS